MAIPRSQPTRDRILEAARQLFGEEGYERTTIRAVAAAADIHPSMVMRYYESKDGLFAAAAAFDLALPELSHVPRREIGRTLVLHFLRRWQSKTQELPALLRVAVTHEQARKRLIEIFSTQLAPTIAVVSPRQQAQTRAALIATQILGLAFTRFVLKLPPVVALSEDIVVEHIGATVQRYLVSDAIY
jgi:AcrR family transcriptional regulator